MFDVGCTIAMIMYNLQLGLTDSTNPIASQSYTEIPYIEVPLNKSKCAANYTHAPLVSACDVLPSLSSSRCIPVPNCTQATCLITELSATVDVKLYNCFSPPAVGIIVRDQNSGNVFISDRSSNSKILIDQRDHSQLSLTVVQHTNEMSVGVQVCMSEYGTLILWINCLYYS